MHGTAWQGFCLWSHDCDSCLPGVWRHFRATTTEQAIPWEGVLCDTTGRTNGALQKYTSIFIFTFPVTLLTRTMNESLVGRCCAFRSQCCPHLLSLGPAGTGPSDTGRAEARRNSRKALEDVYYCMCESSLKFFRRTSLHIGVPSKFTGESPHPHIIYATHATTFHPSLGPSLYLSKAMYHRSSRAGASTRRPRRALRALRDSSVMRPSSRVEIECHHR